MSFEERIEAEEKARVERTKAAAAQINQDGCPEPTNETRKLNPAVLAAEKVASVALCSGINHTRNAVLAEDARRSQATREKYGKA
jgi:hypothetical protein